jgi:hypothetical protein
VTLSLWYKTHKHNAAFLELTNFYIAQFYNNSILSINDDRMLYKENQWENLIIQSSLNKIIVYSSNAEKKISVNKISVNNY